MGPGKSSQPAGLQCPVGQGGGTPDRRGGRSASSDDALAEEGQVGGQDEELTPRRMRMADRAAGIPIVREGAPFVAVLSGVTALAAALGWTTASIILGGITLFTGWFFRNPHRLIPTLEGAVVAPGDGKIIEIQEDYEPRF